MELSDLRAFLAVVSERSFSRAATKLQRTQPAISQAVRRLESELGQKLFDRSSTPGILTEAGNVLRDYAERIARLSDDAIASMTEIEDLRRGRVLIGANDAGVAMLLPLIAEFHQSYPKILVDIRRIHLRHLTPEILQGNFDFGLTTFSPSERRLRSVPLGVDDLVALVSPKHPFSRRSKITFLEWAAEPIIFHNDPSPTRDRVMKLAERVQGGLNIRLAVPTLDGIKTAVEMGLGVSLLPRRCVAAELQRKQLVGIPIPELRLPRRVQLVYRRSGRLSNAAAAFLAVAKNGGGFESADGKRLRA